MKNESTQQIYTETIESVEKWSARIVVGMLWAPVFFFTPVIIWSYVKYFFYDAGNDAFQLPLTMAWVKKILKFLFFLNLKQIYLLFKISILFESICISICVYHRVYAVNCSFWICGFCR